MSKKKSKKGRPNSDVIVQAQSEVKKPKVVKQWDEYFEEGGLKDWQRLMLDLGFEGEFASKKKCRKALDKVWVNITDFLAAVKAGKTPYLKRFRSEWELAEYTKRTHKVYPRALVVKGSPLTKLLAFINNPAERYNGGGRDIVGLLQNTHI